jgi:uridine kinase
MTIDLKKKLLSRPPHNGKYYLVAVDGRGGSGKTRLAAYLPNLLKDFTFIEGDDYFEPNDDPRTWGDFNDDRFIEDVIKPLKSGPIFHYRPYDYDNQVILEGRLINIEKGLCLERCYSFAFDLDWDLKIWVETPRDICLERGLARDNDIGMDRALVAWRDVWQPREDVYIHGVNPLKAADIVIDGTRPFDEQVA